jgi:hypothetical protein
MKGFLFCVVSLFQSFDENGLNKKFLPVLLLTLSFSFLWCTVCDIRASIVHPRDKRRIQYLIEKWIRFFVERKC